MSNEAYFVRPATSWRRYLKVARVVLACAFIGVYLFGAVVFTIIAFNR